MTNVRFHEMADGRRIAHRHTDGEGPMLVFLPGYMSDMDGGKATAVFDWAVSEGRSALLLDYSGCGQSSGNFADGSLSRWRDEVLELINTCGSQQTVLLIGSSMGGWLNLMVGEALGDRLAALIGIASAPDFTEWGRSEADKVKLAAGATIFDPNPYGPDPTPMHAKFWSDGQANRMLDRTIEIDAPVRLIHGQRDADVPWEISLRLAKALRSESVQTIFIKDGDHRLSRDEDIALLIAQCAQLVAASQTP